MKNTCADSPSSTDSSNRDEITRNAHDKSSVSTSTSEFIEKNSDSSVSMALVVYNEESVFPLHRTEREFSFAGRQLKIKQNWSGLGVAAVVWDAAVVLCKYLEAHPDVVQDKNVIELGAGTGLVGLVSAFLGGRTVITDRQEVLDFLKLSVLENSSPEDRDFMTVEALDWTKDLSEFGKFDVILGADIVYIEDVFDDLLRTVVHLSDKDTVILLSCRIRYDRDTFFLTQLSNNFYIKEILYDEETDVKLFKAKKR